MNPEFVRNLWLELSPRRLLSAGVLLGLVFFAAAVPDGGLARPAEIAEFLYYVIAVAWGARNAGLAVVGEIRDRTWDAQRLSSLGAAEMTWGKLFGSTIYNWYAGGLCLLVILAHTLVATGPLAALLDLVYFVEIGIIAQAAALLASLIAVRRRQSHSRGQVFLYQLAGLAAALAVFIVWEMADPAGSLLIGKAPTEFVTWWGAVFDIRPFLLLSLAAFTAWIFVGCYRLMRVELKMVNGPLVWLGFLVFIGLYVAGFDTLLSSAHETAGWDAPALRLALAASTFATLSYVMVFLEPKDRVHFRWLGTQIGRGNLTAFFGGLQAFMVSYAATVLVTALLIWWRWATSSNSLGELALIAAGIGFLTRDVAIFIVFSALPGRRGGDLGAIMTIVALYVLLPAILHGLGSDGALMLFYPKQTDPAWLSPALGWGEALLLVMLALGRIALPERRGPAVA